MKLEMPAQKWRTCVIFGTDEKKNRSWMMCEGLTSERLILVGKINLGSSGPCGNKLSFVRTKDRNNKKYLARIGGSLRTISLLVRRDMLLNPSQGSKRVVNGMVGVQAMEHGWITQLIQSSGTTAKSMESHLDQSCEMVEMIQWEKIALFPNGMYICNTKVSCVTVNIHFHLGRDVDNRLPPNPIGQVGKSNVHQMHCPRYNLRPVIEKEKELINHNVSCVIECCFSTFWESPVHLTKLTHHR